MDIRHVNIEYNAFEKILEKYGFIFDDEYTRAGNNINLLKYYNKNTHKITASVFFDFDIYKISSYHIESDSLSNIVEKSIDKIKIGIKEELLIITRENNIDSILNDNS